MPAHKGIIAEVIPDRLVERATRGVGMANHFLSRQDFVFGDGGVVFGGFIPKLLVGFADTRHTSEQNGEQIMQVSHKMGLL